MKESTSYNMSSSSTMMKGILIVKKLKSIGSNHGFNFSSSSPDLIVDNKENTTNESDPIFAFRKPKLCSETLFDPKLLQAFNEAVSQYFSAITTSQCTPPGGAQSVILYTTSVRAIRKTFEDCERIRFLLESFGVLFYVRDVSMHAHFKKELCDVLEQQVTPPRLFVNGRYIGGAEDVSVLHEQGKFRPLFYGMPTGINERRPCSGCAGFHFLVCSQCSGSRKQLLPLPVNHPHSYSASAWTKCMNCNENGLIICPICSSS